MTEREENTLEWKMNEKRKGVEETQALRCFVVDVVVGALWLWLGEHDDVSR